MKNILEQKLILELFYYREGFLYWKINRKGNAKKDKKAGCVANFKKGSRRVIGVKGKLFIASRLIFLYHKGYMPEMVDHEDRNTLNDKIENLRDASPNQNNRNRRSAKNSSSQYLGVCLVNKKYWRAMIVVNSKAIYLGSFSTQEKAALEYNKAAVKHHKEFANLNIIKINN